MLLCIHDYIGLGQILDKSKLSLPTVSKKTCDLADS